jgi:glycosyltransferase involved in cell wall biosynthesis
MKLLIVGNGSIGIHNKNKFFINNHTGYFLQKIRNHHSLIFTQNSTLYDINNNLQNFDLASHNLDFTILPNKKSISFFPLLIRLIINSEFLYIFYPGTLGKIVAIISIFFKKPIGLYIRGQYYNQNFIDHIILKESKFILTVSPSIAYDLLKFCSNVDVIKPMISINHIDFKMDRNYVIPKVWNLLFVGRVEERKGIYELVEIAKYLKDNGFEFILNIVGGGDLFEEITKKILKLGLQRNLLLHGLVSDKDQLIALYNGADSFIFTSHDEGFPRVLYEAMASALPIFTTFVGGISGRMKHLENCIEIPVKNAKQASEIVSRYLNEMIILELIGKNGQQTLESIIDGTLLSHADLLLEKLNNDKQVY